MLKKALKSFQDTAEAAKPFRNDVDLQATLEEYKGVLQPVYDEIQEAQEAKSKANCESLAIAIFSQVLTLTLAKDAIGKKNFAHLSLASDIMAAMEDWATFLQTLENLPGDASHSEDKRINVADGDLLAMWDKEHPGDQGVAAWVHSAPQELQMLLGMSRCSNQLDIADLSSILQGGITPWLQTWPSVVLRTCRLSTSLAIQPLVSLLVILPLRALCPSLLSGTSLLPVPLLSITPSPQGPSHVGCYVQMMLVWARHWHPTCSLVLWWISWTEPLEAILYLPS